MINLEQCCQKVRQIAQNAGQFIQKQRETFQSDQVETKGIHDYVSYVDKAAEELIVSALRDIIADAGFLTEEGTIEQCERDYTWIIDPLDGTTNFIHGLDPYTVSIGLSYQTTVVLGVVYVVGTHECFYAWKDGGAYLNGEKIQTSTVKYLSDALLITGFPYSTGNKIDAYLGLFRYLTFNSHGIRRFGSAAADIAYVAAGRAEVFFQTNLKPWDVAAGIIIAQEAGAIVDDFAGTQNMLHGSSILVSNTSVRQEITQLIQQYFPGHE